MNFLIEWFARHSIAANMLVLATIIGGLFAARELPKEIIPHIETDTVTITAGLPGASPESIAALLCTPIENILKPVAGIEHIRSSSLSNQCIINLELESSSDIKKITSEINNALDFFTLPALATKPVIINTLKDVMITRLSVSGLVDYNILRSTANKVALDLKSRGISKVKVIEEKTRQITIEIPQARLQQYQISLTEIANTLRQNGLSVPTGHLDSGQGISSVVVSSRYNSANDITNTVLRSLPDGSQLQLGDIATIKDELSALEARVNGEPSIAISIYQGTNTDLFDISGIVNKYVNASQQTLPAGVKMLVVFDNAQFFSTRMNYLKSNFFSGLLISSIILLLWLRFRLAFWITADIPIAFAGGLIWLYLMGGSINMVSAFGLIIVLGIVCDDAIVIGENIYRHQCSGKPGLEGAISGAKEVAHTVIFAVSTTVLMFIPLLFLPGNEGKLMQPLPLIVIAILIASLIEALLVLPTHLSHQRQNKKQTPLGFAIAEKMDAFILSYYRPLLEKALAWRYAVVVFCASLFIISISLVFSGTVKVHFFSAIETEIATGAVNFPDSDDTEKTRQAVMKMEQAALQLKADLYNELGTEQIKLVRTFIANDAIHGEVYLSLATAGERKISSTEIMHRWQEKTGVISGANALSFTSAVQLDPASFNILLQSNDITALKKASEALRIYLQNHEGTRNTLDSFSQTHEQVTLQLKPEAFDLGLNSQNVSTQVHLALEGTVLQNLDNARVILAMPREERSSLSQLENLPIQINPLSTVPLSSIANISLQPSPDNILHIDGQTTSSISTQLDERLITPAALMDKVEDGFLKHLDTRFPGVSWKRTGAIEAEAKIRHYLTTSFILSLLAMFILLAVFLNSYFQPFMIFTAIPFGIVGALLGHLLLGHQLTLWSLAGMIAVSGIVVNNNMVLIFFIKEKLQAGAALSETLLMAGAERFRPIMLTTITTFAGVLPTIAGNSWEAQFLIPLAISIGCGVVFAALLTLFLVPCIYLIAHDIKTRLSI